MILNNRPVLLINVNPSALSASIDTIPISLGYIGAYLKSRGFPVELWDDLQDRPLSFLKVREFVLGKQPLYVGFSAYQDNIERIRLISKYIKTLNPDLPVVIGGPQATFMPSEGLLDLRYVDIISRGGGERIALDLAEALQGNRSFCDIPGISYCRNGVHDNSDTSAYQEDLDAYPSPYLSETIDLSAKDTVILLTSRGCTYPCIFCYTPRAFHHKVVFHSIERVIEEMRYCAGKGIRQFWIADPNFSYSRTRMETLLDSIIKSGLDINFWCQTRYDMIDDHLMRKLKRAGISTIAFGMESANPKVLDTIKKKEDVRRLTEAIKLAQSYGVSIELFTIYALPGETFSEAYETVRFLKDHEIRIEGNSGSQQLQIYYGTQLYKDYENLGIVPRNKYRPRYLAIGDDFETTALSSKEIERIKAIWFINNAFFQEKIESGESVIPPLSFLIRHAEDLAQEPEFYFYLTTLLREVEEVELLHKYLSNSEAQIKEWINMWIAQIPFYRDSDGKAESGTKVFVDFAGYVKGASAPNTTASFWPIIIGEGRYLPEFEAAFLGMEAGGKKNFTVHFPSDYPDGNLAGKEIAFDAMVHKIMNPVFPGSIEELLSLRTPNNYRFGRLDRLRDVQEAVYYLWLRSMSNEELMKNPKQLLDLISDYLSLGKFADAMSLAEMAVNSEYCRNKAFRILIDNGLFEFTLELMNRGNDMDAQTRFLQGLSWMGLKEYNKALEAWQPIYSDKNALLLHYMTEAEKMKNDSREVIQEMEEKLLSAQIEASLMKERMR